MGDRLDVLLGLIGVWVVYFYSGRRIPGRVILLALPLAVILSQPILEERQAGGNVSSSVSTIERFSRISSYGVLDISLAIHNEPRQLHAQLTEPNRWLDLPGYFVPSALWHGRPNLAARRLGLYTAQDFGNIKDQATGFPTTYITRGMADWRLAWCDYSLSSVWPGTRKRDPTPHSGCTSFPGCSIVLGVCRHARLDIL